MKSSDRVRLSIETSIRKGELPPGRIIDEQLLADNFKVSKTPVREALLYLRAQGIVENVSRTGMAVRRLTIHELLSVWELLAEMEAVAARMACDRMTDEELAELKLIHERAEKVIADNDALAWSECNYEFHMVLYNGCKNQFLKEDLIRLRLRTVGYLKLAYGSIGQIKASQEQHGRLLEALLTRDAESTTKMMIQHISLAEGAKALTELLMSIPESLLGYSSR